MNQEEIIEQRMIEFWNTNLPKINPVMRSWDSVALHEEGDWKRLESIVMKDIAIRMEDKDSDEDILKDVLDLNSDIMVNAIREWWIRSYIVGVLHTPEDHMEQVINIAEDSIQQQGRRGFFNMRIDDHGHRRCLELATLTTLYAHFLNTTLGFDQNDINTYFNDEENTFHKDVYIMLYTQQSFRVTGKYPEKGYLDAYKEIQEEYLRLRTEKGTVYQSERRFSNMVPKDCMQRVPNFGRQLAIELVMLGREAKEVIQVIETPDSPAWKLVGFRAWASVAEEGRLNIPLEIQRSLTNQAEQVIEIHGNKQGTFMGVEPDSESGNKHCMTIAELALLHVNQGALELGRDPKEIHKSVFTEGTDDYKHVRQQFTFLRMLQQWQEEGPAPETIN